MLDDHRIGSCWLRFVPNVLRCIEGYKRFGLIDEGLGFGITRSGGK